MKPKKEDPSTKEAILNACLEVATKEGFEGITVRKISEKARVNLALINYYFGSKEKMIDEVIRRILKGFMESFSIIDDHSLTPRERLKSFVLTYVGVVRKYPEIARRILAKGAIQAQSQHEYVNFLKIMGLEKIKALLQEITGETRHDILSMMVLQIGGSIIFPLIMHPLIKSDSGLPDFNDQQVHNYLDMFLNFYLNRFESKED